MTAGQLMDILKSVPKNTELFLVDYAEYTAQPMYYHIQKAIVQVQENEYKVILVDQTSGASE